MEGSELIESLNSLWFFSNVLAPTPQKTLNATVHKTTTAQEESPQEHVEPVVQNDQAPNAEPVTIKCPKCGEVSAEFDSPRKELTPAIFVDIQEAENSSSRKPRQKKKRRSKRKVLGDINERLGVDYYQNYGRFTEETVQTSCGFGSQMLPMYQKKMPPLNDGLAMKQHLKSWAYAVACTVR